MSLLTRISWVCTGLALLGFGVLAAILLCNPAPPPTVQVRAGVVYPGDKTPPYEIVQQYVAVIERYDGETAAPLADLPAPPDEIARAIHTAPEWAADWERDPTRRFYDALQLHLNNFVADPARTSRDEVWERQKAIIATRFEYRIVHSGVKTPIPIGRGFDALTAMVYNRAKQMLMFWGWFVAMSFLAIRGGVLAVQAIRSRLGGRWRVWGAIVFCVLFFPFNLGVLSLIPVAALANPMGDAVATPAMGDAVGVLTLAVASLVPFTLLSTLFDLLVHPPGKARPGRHGVSEREPGRRDETPAWRTCDGTPECAPAGPRVAGHARNRAGRGLHTAGHRDLAVAGEDGA